MCRDDGSISCTEIFCPGKSPCSTLWCTHPYWPLPLLTTPLVDHTPLLTTPPTERGCPTPSDAIPSDALCEFNEDTSCHSIGCENGQVCCTRYYGCAPTCVDPVVVCRYDGGTIIQAGDTYSPPEQCKTWYVGQLEGDYIPSGECTPDTV